MDSPALPWMFGALGVLLLMSGFFSIAETSMMAINRYRLRHMVSQGHAGAKRVDDLLKRTDMLLGAILIGNNLVNAAAATLASLIAVELVGQGKLAYAVSTLGISFLIIVFAEITPKVVGATYPEKIAPYIAYLLKPIQWVLQPGVWFVNLFVRPMLLLIGVRPGENTEMQKLSPGEIRTLVLESSSFMPKKHTSILLNLFDLGSITVQDIMVPRARIESVCLEDGMETVSRQLATSYHMRLPVFRDHEGNLAGVLHLRKILGPLHAGQLDEAAVLDILDDPYFVPASTSVLAQMQFFQENRERLALVVDEYGEMMGLVTLEDILEEIIGKFTTTLPAAAPLSWDHDGTASGDGSMAVRDVNRALGLDLPTDGPKTLSGLIVEHLQDIPEADVSVKIGEVSMEIVAAQGRTIKTVRIFRPVQPKENVEASGP